MMLSGQQPVSITNVYKTMKRPRRLKQRNHLVWWSMLCLAWAAKLPTAQSQNLVPNAGFEETDSCWQTLGLGALQDWYSAYLTPDHLQSCLPYGSVNGLPMNFFTY